jgi:hypothetical protein
MTFPIVVTNSGRVLQGTEGAPNPHHSTSLIGVCHRNSSQEPEGPDDLARLTVANASRCVASSARPPILEDVTSGDRVFGSIRVFALRVALVTGFVTLPAG